MIAIFDIRHKAVFLLAAISLFAFLGTRGLNEPDEGRYAETYREMSLQDNWLVPHLAGAPHLNKPPLIYWISAICIKVLGVNEWAVRLPSALAALGTVLLTMHLAGLLYGPGVSWKAGLILLTSGLFFILSRLSTTDMLLTFLITAAITAFVDYAIRSRKWSLLIFYICLGLGFLTKGPIAFLIPFCAVIPFVISFTPEKKDAVWRWHWIPGLLLALAIGLSWFLVLFAKYPELVHYYFQNEFVDRIASDTHNRSKSIWFYTLALLSGFVPWIILFPRIWKDLWSWQRRKDSFRTWLFAGWIFIPWVVLHLVVSKLATYILPLFPAFAILSACILERRAGQFKVETRIIAGLMTVATVSVPLVCHLIGRHYNEAIPLAASFLATLALLAVGWIYLLTTNRLSKSRSFVMINVLLLLSMLMLSRQADVIIVGSSSSLRHVADAVRKEQSKSGSGGVLIYNGRRYSMEFYLQKLLIREHTSHASVLPIPEDNASHFIENRDDFLAANHDTNLLIIIKGSRINELLDNGWVQLFEQHGVSVLKRDHGFMPAEINPL